MFSIKLTRRIIDPITFVERAGLDYTPRQLEDWVLDAQLGSSLSYALPPSRTIPPPPPPPPDDSENGAEKEENYDDSSSEEDQFDTDTKLISPLATQTKKGGGISLTQFFTSPSPTKNNPRPFHRTPSQKSLGMQSIFSTKSTKSHRQRYDPTASAHASQQFAASMRSMKSADPHASARFELFKAIETKEEFSKVQFSSFLRDIYRVAQEDNKDQMKLGNKNETPKKKPPPGSDGSISLEGVDLLGLEPNVALSKIFFLHSGEQLDSDSFLNLLKAACFVLSQEPTLIDLRERETAPEEITVVGDLHGSLKCLVKVLDVVGYFEMADLQNKLIVFDGDYVDRGNHSLEVLCTLLLLKLSLPKNIILLRGNHEDTMTASMYGFREELDEKYGLHDDYERGQELWDNIGNVFASFPIALRTQTAVILHGGIPTDDFELDLLAAVSAESRMEMPSVQSPEGMMEELVQGIMWSDPAAEDGLVENERGAGVEFGPDITRDFLDRHNLKYIIRAHEPVEEGTKLDDIGDGRGVITVFSVAAYPFDEGTNFGAVLHLEDKEDGCFETTTFSLEDAGQHLEAKQLTQQYSGVLESFLESNRKKLTKAFQSTEDANGRVTAMDWGIIMAQELDLPDVEWDLLQPVLAPTTKPKGDLIDWKHFLMKHSTKKCNVDLLDADHLSILHENKNKFLHIFQLLDTDGNGTIDKDEFLSGISTFNDHLPHGKKLDESQAKELFQVLDIDGDGEVSIDEFAKGLEQSAELRDLAESFDPQELKRLQDNHEMLLVAFKYLDTDRSGSIDREEFHKGIELLNKRLKDGSKFEDPNALFDKIDVDGSSEIGKSRISIYIFVTFQQTVC